MSQKRIATVLATEQHLIKGKVPSGGERLLDILNSPATEYLRLEDAEIFRRYGLKPAHRVARAVLRKAGIALALRIDPTHEAPQKRVDRLAPRRIHPAVVVVLGYDIVGTVHLRGQADGVNALMLDLTPFFPISDATVTYGGDPRQRIAARVAIVNRQFVSLLHIDDGGPDRPDVSEAVRQILGGQPAAAEATWTAPLGAPSS